MIIQMQQFKHQLLQITTMIWNLDGWSADYQDPSTDLNPFNAEDGFYLKILGLDPSKDADKITSIGLDQYTQKLKNRCRKYRRS